VLQQLEQFEHMQQGQPEQLEWQQEQPGQLEQQQEQPGQQVQLLEYKLQEQPEPQEQRQQLEQGPLCQPVQIYPPQWQHNEQLLLQLLLEYQQLEHQRQQEGL